MVLFFIFIYIIDNNNAKIDKTTNGLMEFVKLNTNSILILICIKK